MGGFPQFLQDLSQVPGRMMDQPQGIPQGIPGAGQMNYHHLINDYGRPDNSTGGAPDHQFNVPWHTLPNGGMISRPPMGMPQQMQAVPGGMPHPMQQAPPPPPVINDIYFRGNNHNYSNLGAEMMNHPGQQPYIQNNGLYWSPQR